MKYALHSSCLQILALSAEYQKKEGGVLNEFQETMSSSLQVWLSEAGGGLHPNICFTQGAINRHSLLVVDYLIF